jgi:hypothetical protein
MLPIIRCLLLSCFVAGNTIIAFESLGVACDHRCRHIKMFAKDQGNGKYACSHFKIEDCRLCVDLAAGGCEPTRLPGTGDCKKHKALPQSVTKTPRCNLICPLPPLEHTEGISELFAPVFVDIGKAHRCSGLIALGGS